MKSTSEVVVAPRAILQACGYQIIPVGKDGKVYLPVSLEAIKSFVSLLENEELKTPSEIPGVMHLAAVFRTKDFIIIKLAEQIPDLIRRTCGGTKWLENLGDTVQNLPPCQSKWKVVSILEPYRRCGKGWFASKMKGRAK